MSTADTRTDASKSGGLPDAVARVIQAAHDKKALDLVALDLRHLSSFTDFFVICSGRTSARCRRLPTPSKRRSGRSR